MDKYTAYPPDTSCDFCGENVPVRLVDNDGYAPDELICEECFSHELAGWDGVIAVCFIVLHPPPCR